MKKVLTFFLSLLAVAVLASPSYSQSARCDALRSVCKLLLYAYERPTGYFDAEALIKDASAAMNAARAEGADVSGLESGMAIFSAKARRLDAQKRIGELEAFGSGRQSSYHTAELLILDTAKAIADAKSNGVPIEDLEKRLPLLSSKARLAYAVKQMKNLEDFADGKPSGYLNANLAISDTERAVAKAKRGNKTRFLEKKLPGLIAKARQLSAENRLEELTAN